MDYIIVALLGMAGGAFCVFMITEARRKALKEQKLVQEARAEQIENHFLALRAKEKRYDEEVGQLKSARAEFEKRCDAEMQVLKAARGEFDRECDEERERLKAAHAEFDNRVIQYTEFQDENAILKRDLRNIHVQVRKVQLDTEVQRKRHAEIQQKVSDLGSRYLKENVKWISASLNPNNFAASKQRLLDVIERCRGMDFEVPDAEERSLQEDLKSEFQMIVRAAFEREEQARIKAQIREEQIREREIEKEQRRLEHEREAIRVALERALAEAEGQHTEEVERLRARLAEAEEKARRATSQAQLTKSGHVYVISNIGSFGDGVFKVGMTRRLEPKERILELGSASVPFPFDIHMMISSNDAPALETALHRKLFRHRINKTNPRKEFFKTDLTAIYEIVKEQHGDVEYVADAEALQYRQSLTMTDDDQQFIESVYDGLGDEEETVLDEL